MAVGDEWAQRQLVRSWGRPQRTAGREASRPMKLVQLTRTQRSSQMILIGLFTLIRRGGAEGSRTLTGWNLNRLPTAASERDLGVRRLQKPGPRHLRHQLRLVRTQTRTQRLVVPCQMASLLTLVASCLPSASDKVLTWSVRSRDRV